MVLTDILFIFIRDMVDVKHKIIDTNIIVSFPENYMSFADFFESNKKAIYQNIIKLFDNMSNNIDSTLKITSTIGSVPWYSEFTYDKEQKYILVKTILPFFEKKEEYEICAEIMKIYNKL